MQYLRYLRYVVVHKWWVLVECFRAGLYWRGLVHDLSKLLPSEFFPYASFFYGKKEQIRDETGYYKPTDTGDTAFDFAWLLHQKRNDHHWQWWVLPEDEGGVKVLPMSEAARVEMLCDWRGAGKAQGTPDVAAWYRKNGHKMQLHPETRAWVEAALGLNRKCDQQETDMLMFPTSPCEQCGWENWVGRKRCRNCCAALVQHPDPVIDREVRLDYADGVRYEQNAASITKAKS